MANITAKTSSNVFYQARCNAATHNEQLSSREGAADYAPTTLHMKCSIRMLIPIIDRKLKERGL